MAQWLVAGAVGGRRIGHGWLVWPLELPIERTLSFGGYPKLLGEWLKPRPEVQKLLGERQESLGDGQELLTEGQELLGEAQESLTERQELLGEGQELLAER